MLSEQSSYITGQVICVDGGIEKHHLDQLQKIGADEVAVGVKRVLSW